MIENETTTAVGSLSGVLRHLADQFDAAMPEPSSVTYHTYDDRSPIVGLVFAVEGAACVETWAAKYGSKWGSSQQPFAEGTQWLTTDSVELMGVTVQLSGHDPRETEAEVKADAVAIVAEVLTGEVTSPFGPCSGLTPDLRDNTCTNFAAEYVSFPSAVPPATEYRRLCTSCADAAPDRISRRPLTTAPGGYPVERAS